MRKLFCMFVGMVFVISLASRVNAASLLVEWGFNVDGTFYDSFSGNPEGLDDTEYDWVTGLGTLTMTMGSGSYFGAFFNHDIDDYINDYWNEYGVVSGVAQTGQTWEIDEPSYS